MVSDLPDVAEFYQRIGHGLVSGAPVGWVDVRMVDIEVGNAAQSTNVAVMQDGAEIDDWGVDTAVYQALEDLRRVTYQPGQSAWYTAVVTVTAEGSVSFDFDYDNEPEWDIDVVPMTYVEDLEMFPRDEEHRPAWLREKLRLAAPQEPPESAELVRPATRPAVPVEGRPPSAGTDCPRRHEPEPL